MLKMGSRFKTYMAGLAVAGVMAGAAVPAQAGDYSGDMLVRVQGTYLNFNDESTPSRPVLNSMMSSSQR